LHDRSTAALGCPKARAWRSITALPAELFMAKRKGGPRQRLGYRRFPTAAEAKRLGQRSSSRAPTYYINRGPMNASMMRLASATISSALLFSRLVGLFDNGLVEPGE
jgi:hypothetical protein